MKCAKCRREIAESGNRFDVKLYGGRASFHAKCFEGFLRAGAADELEQRAWRESTTAQATAPAAVKGRGEKYQDEPA